MPWHLSNWHYGLEDLEEQSFLCIVLGLGVMYQIVQGSGYGGTLVIVRVDDS